MMSRQTPPRRGKRLRIFVGEAHTWQGQPLYRAILHLAQQQGIAGATVTRGIEGFGPEHHLSTERLPDLSENLPIVIDIVDREECIEAFLPHLDRVVQQGIITVTPVEIVSGGGNA